MAKTSTVRLTKREKEWERREKLAEAKRLARAKERRRSLLIVGGGIGACMALIIAVVGANVWKHVDQTRAAKRIDGLQHYTGLSNTVAASAVKYSVDPPAGGAYSSTLLNCGIYTTQQTTASAVHDLANGAVWITYGAHTPGTEINLLKNKIRTEGLYNGNVWADLTPYPGLSADEIIASAWGYQVKVTNASDPRLDKFLKRFTHGSQTPNPQGSCSGGTGKPQTT